VFQHENGHARNHQYRRSRYRQRQPVALPLSAEGTSSSLGPVLTCGFYTRTRRNGPHFFVLAWWMKNSSHQPINTVRRTLRHRLYIFVGFPRASFVRIKKALEPVAARLRNWNHVRQEGGPPMQPSPQSASTMQVPAEMPTSTRHCDDVVYQA